MAREAICPRCRIRLMVDADSTERWLTCPRCLGSVINPATRDPSEPLPPPPTPPAEPGPQPAPVPEPAPPRAPRPHYCPDCEAPVDPSWRICPHCSCPLRRPRRREYVPVEGETRNDFQITGIVLMIAGIVGIVGYAFLLGGGTVDFKSFDDFFQVTAIVGLVTIVLLTVGLVMSLRRGSGPESAVSGVLGGLGIALVVMIVTVILVIGFFLFLISSCLKACNNQGKSQRPAPVAPAPLPPPKDAPPVKDAPPGKDQAPR